MQEYIIIQLAQKLSLKLYEMKKQPSFIRFKNLQLIGLIFILLICISLVSSYYPGELKGSEQGLVLLMHLNNDSDHGEDNTHFYDFSGTGNNGTCASCPTFTFGIIGKSVNFAGTGTYIDVPHSSSLDITDVITLEAWVYPRDTVTTQSVLGKYNTTSQRAYAFYISSTGPDNTFDFWISSDGDTRDSIIANIIPNKWYHVAGVYNGSWMFMYVNGKLNNSKAVSMTQIHSNTDPFQMGKISNSASYYNGLLEEVAIYHRALSAQEIYNHYLIGVSCGYTGLGDWILNATNKTNQVLCEGYDETINVNGSIYVYNKTTLKLNQTTLKFDSTPKIIYIKKGGIFAILKNLIFG
jgi:hypothetical protein